MYKTTSRSLQSRARKGSKGPISEKARKLNTKISKRNAAHKRWLADAMAKFEADYGYLKK